MNTHQPHNKQQPPLKIAFLAYTDVELLDLSGAQTTINEARQFLQGGYETEVISFSTEPLRTESGITIVPDTPIDKVTNVHTLVIPGGCGARLGTFSDVQLNQLRQLMTRVERVVSICTGSFLLARTGLAPGTRMTTHWASAEQLSRAFPELVVEADRLFIQDGKLWSSAGVTSGIDLTLHLIEQDFGSLAASHVARQLVVFLRRSTSQRQFSDFLHLQRPKSDKVAALVQWLQGRLSDTVSVVQMAEHVAMSERQLHRVFQRELGLTPAAYFESLRMETARTLLTTSTQSVKAIAYVVGYQSYDGFRRAFERAFASSPTQYRDRFGQPEVG